jgi:biotin carboxylase
VTVPTRDETVLFFGSVLDPEHWRPVIEAGYRAAMLYDTTSAYRTREVPPEFSLISEIDFSVGRSAVLERVRQLLAGADVVAVLNVDELRVRLWAEVAAELGVPAMSPAAARVVRSKVAMHRAFDAHHPRVAAPRWCAPADEAEVRAFVRSAGGPVVVKPDGLWGSFFVDVCRTEDEASDRFTELVGLLPGYYGSHHLAEAPAVLVEEFVQGTNHSVEVLVGPGGIHPTPVVDVLTGADVGAQDLHHFIRVAPSRLTDAEQAAVRELAVAGVAATGLEVGIAHVEVIMSSAGPVLLEIGGRPGTNRPSMLRDSAGVDVMTAYVDVLRGRTPDLAVRRRGAAAVVTPFPAERGVLTALHGLDRLRAHHEVAH